MSKTKFEVLASFFRSFAIQVDNDLNNKISILSKYEDESMQKLLSRFEHKAWLLCATAREIRLKESNRRKQQQKPDLSGVLAKLDTKALSVFLKISNKIQEKHKSIIEEHLHPFFPDEKSTIKMNLRKIKEVIDDKKEPSRVIKAALLCRNRIIKYLFKESDLTVKVINCFLDEQCLTLRTEKADPPEWKNITPLKNGSGRYSMSSQKAMYYIKHFVERFLSNPIKLHTVGQTVLVIWLAQAAAYHLRRVCSINEILSLREQQVNSKKSKEGLNTYIFQVKNCEIPITESLYHMLFAILDRRKDNPHFFSLDRSTIENHLKTAALELGYDFSLFPVTLETFLEKPIECFLDGE